MVLTAWLWLLSRCTCLVFLWLFFRSTVWPRPVSRGRSKSVHILNFRNVCSFRDLDKKYVVSILTHLASYLKNRFSRYFTLHCSLVIPCYSSVWVSARREASTLVWAEVTLAHRKVRPVWSHFVSQTENCSIQAARHMLGLQQVNQAGGPGKKKRSGGQVWTLHLHSQEWHWGPS